MTYTCGASKMGWLKCFTTALVGTAVWTVAYTMLGYLLAGQMTPLTGAVRHFLSIGIALICFCGAAYLLHRKWLIFKTQTASNGETVS